MIDRLAISGLQKALQKYPVVALVGPRQVGKTTLAKQLIDPAKSLYLDLERPSDQLRLSDPEFFLEKNADKRIVIDEVQRMLELFPVLRSLVDADRRPGRFLLLGSASDQLLVRSSENLAGRIHFRELHPFQLLETGAESRDKLWLRGGYPLSYLAPSDEDAFEWLLDFSRSYVQRELGTAELRTTPQQLEQFLQLLSSVHGQLINYSNLAQATQLSLPTVKNYLQFFEQMFLIRTLQPFHTNQQKRLVKSPKVYIRDSGLLHLLAGIDTLNSLEGDVIKGASWEGFGIQQIVSMLKPTVHPYFYRTAAGAELDLLLVQNNKPVASFEFKYSNSPHLSKGNTEAIKDFPKIAHYVVTPSNSAGEFRPGVHLISLPDALQLLVEKAWAW
jgi:predicted AAA+ superfamily ATPase